MDGADVLLREVELVRRAVAAGHRLRKQAQIKVRQPLPAVYVVADDSQKESVARWRTILAEELNVKRVLVVSDLARLAWPRPRLDIRGYSGAAPSACENREGTDR
jgi:hypothetical protein